MCSASGSPGKTSLGGTDMATRRKKKSFNVEMVRTLTTNIEVKAVDEDEAKTLALELYDKSPEEFDWEDEEIDITSVEEAEE